MDKVDKAYNAIIEFQLELANRDQYVNHLINMLCFYNIVKELLHDNPQELTIRLVVIKRSPTPERDHPIFNYTTILYIGEEKVICPTFQKIDPEENQPEVYNASDEQIETLLGALELPEEQKETLRNDYRRTMIIINNMMSDNAELSERLYYDEMYDFVKSKL